MKIWKKNLVAAAVLVTVCAGIYVNWLYTQDTAAMHLTETLDAEKVMGDDTLLLEDLYYYENGLLELFYKTKQKICQCTYNGFFQKVG